MDEQQYCLFSPSKMAYIAVDRKARATITTNRDLAKRFSQTAAKNFLKHNVKPSFGAFCVTEIEPSASQPYSRAKQERPLAVILFALFAANPDSEK